MVGPDGLEPSTPRLSSACSNQLSYEPTVEKASWAEAWIGPSFAGPTEGILRQAKGWPSHPKPP